MLIEKKIIGKPENIEEYLEWLKETHSIEINVLQEIRYSAVALKIRHDFEISRFWTELMENMRSYDQEYELSTGYNLFTSQPKRDLETKPWGSFLLKTYRRNCIENISWPKEPEGGWYLPSNWFSRINDIVRTLFIVKYFDGVDYLTEKIKNLCIKHNIDIKVHKEAREEGYYAAHLYIRMDFEIPKIDWDTERIEALIEIQITTQLQEVIRRLLHNYYEKKRKIVVKPPEKWQWDYRCDEFCANYLGHILHYVEGMIMDIRERQKKA